MAISFVNAVSANSGTGTSNTAALTMPTVQDGDVGVLIVATNGNATPTTPTGWTLIGTQAPNTLNEWHYKKTLTAAADSGTALSVPLGSGFRWALSVAVYRGATFDASTPTVINNATATANPLQAAHTPTSADCLWVGLASSRGATTNVSVTWSSAPSGWTALASRTSTSSVSTTTQNVGTAISDKQLTGQAGISQTQTQWTTSGNNGSYGDVGIMLAPKIAPAITSANNMSGTQNSALTPFSVTTTGNPVPTLSKTGSLPAGVTFTDNGNGTATIAGTPTNSGSFPISITATNGFGSDAVQNPFTITIASSSTAPNDNEELAHALKRVSGTDLDLDGAANAWAGTTGLAMLGALNAKNGSVGLGLLAVLNQLAGRSPGDIKWDVNGAAGRIG